MKIIKHLFVAATFILAASTTAEAKNGNVPQCVYMFGFAASFNDTIVHFTEIQAVDSVWLSRGNKFLLSRDNYSYQLRQYLADRQMPNRTCVVFYDRKLSRIQKKFLKMKKLYATGTKGKPSRNEVRSIALGEFRFTPINMAVTEQ